MSKRMRKFLGYSAIVLLSLVIGIMIGKHINNSKKKEEPVVKVEKIAILTIMMGNNEDKTSYIEEDLGISDEMLNTYIEIINSNEIKNKVKEKYSDVGNVELKNTDKSSVIEVIYACGNNSDEDCLEINKEYVSAFIDYMEKNNVRVYILSEARISTRLAEE